MRRRTGNFWGPVIGALLIVLTLNSVGQATHQPADKVSGSSSKVVQVPTATTGGAGTSANTIIGPFTVRSSKPTDLIMSVTLEPEQLRRQRLG